MIPRLPPPHEHAVVTLLQTPTVTVKDVSCRGTQRQISAEERAPHTQLVFAYRGVYVRHIGHEAAVADANQVLLFNGDEGYRVSHPVPGGDHSLSVVPSQPLLRELAPRALLRDGPAPAFRPQLLRIDARAQALMTVLRHSLRAGLADTLEAESLALTLMQRTMGPRTAHRAGPGPARRRLVDRAKLVLVGEPGRRWTLAEIAAEVNASPVYLTQAFQQVEGMPLYRYQLRLRLARALALLPEHDDLTALGLSLGFSSHSHFSAAFRQVYGCSPSEFRRTSLGPR